MTRFVRVGFVMQALLGPSVQAQIAGPARAERLQLDAAITSPAREDRRISPVRYAGFGIALALSRRFERGQLDVPTRLRVAGARLLPSGAAAAGSEQLLEASLSTGILRHLSGAAAAGVELRGTTTRLVHRFADAAAPHALYHFTRLSIGPGVAWRPSAGRRFELAGSVPLVSLVDRPYANTRPQAPPHVWRTVSAAAARGVQASASLRSPGSRMPSIGYELELFHLAGDQPMRTASHALSVTFAARSLVWRGSR